MAKDQENKELLICLLIGSFAIFILLYMSMPATATIGFAVAPAMIQESCEDYDGTNIFSKGTTIGPKSETSVGKATKIDYCKDSTTLVEFVCRNDLIAQEEVQCDCHDGLCL